MRIHHDRLGSRPRRIELPDGTELSDELVLALFFALDQIRRTEEQARTSRS
jgi:hypothetical protein